MLFGLFRTKREIVVKADLRAAAIKYRSLAKISIGHALDSDGFSPEAKESVQKQKDEIIKEFGSAAMWFIAENF